MSLYGNIYYRSKEKKSKILTKNTSPYFHSALLFIWPLTTLKGTHFSKGFSYVRINLEIGNPRAKMGIFQGRPGFLGIRYSGAF